MEEYGLIDRTISRAADVQRRHPIANLSLGIAGSFIHPAVGIAFAAPAIAEQFRNRHYVSGLGHGVAHLAPLAVPGKGILSTVGQMYAGPLVHSLAGSIQNRPIKRRLR